MIQTGIKEAKILFTFIGKMMSGVGEIREEFKKEVAPNYQQNQWLGGGYS